MEFRWYLSTGSLVVTKVPHNYKTFSLRKAVWKVYGNFLYYIFVLCYIIVPVNLKLFYNKKFY